MGRKRAQKHVERGLCIKRITNSVNAVRWLNRFGHSISDNEINALESKPAEEQINNQTPFLSLLTSSQAYLLPSASIIVIIIWNLFTTLLYIGPAAS